MFSGLAVLLLGQIIGNTIVPIGMKLTAPYVGPVLLVFLRFVVSTLLLFLLARFYTTRKLHRKEYREFAFLGLLLAINVVLFSIGILHTTIIMSSLIYALTPILVGVAGHFFLHERLDKYKIAGLIVAIVGLLFLLSQSYTDFQEKAVGEPFGNILILIATLAYSYYVFQSRKVLHYKNHLALQTTYLTFLFTTIFAFIALLITSAFGMAPPATLPQEGIVGFIVIGTFSAAQYLFLQYGVKRTNAFTASIFQYIAPFIASAAAIPLLGEHLTPGLVIGGLLILFGVFIATTYEELEKRKVIEKYLSRKK